MMALPEYMSILKLLSLSEYFNLIVIVTLEGWRGSIQVIMSHFKEMGLSTISCSETFTVITN